MKDICQGCNISYCFCYFKLAKAEELCPCINCLVKIVCKTDCDNRLDKRKNLLGGRNMRQLLEDYGDEISEMDKGN